MIKVASGRIYISETSQRKQAPLTSGDRNFMHVFLVSARGRERTLLPSAVGASCRLAYGMQRALSNPQNGLPHLISIYPRKSLYEVRVSSHLFVYILNETQKSRLTFKSFVYQ